LRVTVPLFQTWRWLGPPAVDRQGAGSAGGGDIAADADGEGPERAAVDRVAAGGTGGIGDDDVAGVAIGDSSRTVPPFWVKLPVALIAELEFPP